MWQKAAKPKLVLFFILSIILKKCESISDGINVDIAEAPFMLSLRLNGEHICGAAVISPDWGITAAHCLESSDGEKSLTLRSGSAQRDSGGLIHNISETIIHPDYNSTDEDYDIGLLKVDPPFEFGETTQPIKLPMNSNVALKTDWASIAGWGAVPTQTDDNDSSSKNLKYAQIPKINKIICAKEYEHVYYLTPRQICYGFQQGGPDACKGDSGGPLYNTDNILIGITSWGDECGVVHTPGVYMDITLVVEWIRNTTDIPD